jgi:hypothetical protein
MVRTPLSECYGQLVEFRPLRVKSPTVIPYDEGRANASSRLAIRSQRPPFGYGHDCAR